MKFQVKTKTKSIRCEICHQTDQFDEATETCLRCQSLVVANLLPQTPNSQFQDWMVNLGNANRASLSTRELFRVVQNAFQFYWQNFLLLISITTVSLIPLCLLKEDLVRYSFGIKDADLRIVICNIIPFIMYSFVIGTLDLAILKRHRGENITIFSAYRNVFSRGIKYLFTSLVGRIYQLVGIAFCWLGVLYTYPSGAFASEIAIAEEVYNMSAFKASHRLGMRIPIFLLLLGLIGFITPHLITETLNEVFGNNLYGTGISFSDFSYFIIVFFNILIWPLFVVIKMLAYLRLQQNQDATANNQNTIATFEPRA
ncbi:MAG: hypothetical protein WAQ98_24705 [Blastocatellia bacterium]